LLRQLRSRLGCVILSFGGDPIRKFVGRGRPGSPKPGQNDPTTETMLSILFILSALVIFVSYDSSET
jgi:hypothetical protein